jgi:nucleotide-binding universal stress UspA family protein
VKALVWLRADTWEATIDAARELVPEDAETSLLHVADEGGELAAELPRTGLLGRRHPPPQRTIEQISDDAAAELLAAARERLGRDVRTDARRGRLERVVLEAAEGADLIVCARDGDFDHRGPKNLAPPTRFVVDHAPCAVMLVWPQAPPEQVGPKHPPPPPPPPH